MTTEKIDGVSVTTKANVYFDGKCVSHSLTQADGTKLSVGVVLPAQLTFNTGAPEIMELISGQCRVRLKGETEWKNYRIPVSQAIDDLISRPFLLFPFNMDDTIEGKKH